jgi:K+-sensing histidine kinase KdpD
MSPAATRFDLNQVLQELSHSQYENHHHRIEVILDLATNLPRTTADVQLIECVILALFARSRNAIETRRSRGTITIRTELKFGRIQLSITDDGVADTPPPFEASLTRTPEEDLNLTTCTEIVQDQAGELYSWCPHHSGYTTIIMDLPTDS